MSESNPVGLKGSLREAIVIVASILVAFGLDAWWDDLVERRQERELLVTLQQEFEGTLAASRQVARRHEAALDATTMIISEVRRAMQSGQAIQVPDTMLFRFMYSATMNQSTGALDAVLRGGQVGLIESPNLRAALTSWPGDFDDMMADEADAARHMFDVVYNGFLTAGDISHVSQNLAAYADGSLPPEQLAWTTEVTPTAQLASDLGLRSLRLAVALNAHSTLQRRTEAVLELLAAELGEA